MARSKENPWIPSGGVLIVAIAAAVVAAVLLNIYISAVEAPYEEKVLFFVMKQDVPKGKPIEKADLGTIAIPKPLLEEKAFERFVRARYDSVVIGKPARWGLHKGNLLTYRDVLAGSEAPVLESLPDGYELVKVEIEPDEMLQPGMFVNLRGRFDTDPDRKKENIEIKDVLYGVQVKAVGGSAEAVESRRRSADSMQVALPSTLVKQLLQIKQVMYSEKFLVAKLSSGAEEKGLRGDPTLAPEALELIRKPGPAAAAVP